MQKHYQKACDSLAAQTLYVVATPIGNLADITLRALPVLAHVDIGCAEDTRVTAQLLSAYGIQAKLLSVREHNEQHMADKIIAALAEGKSVAQVSDAGTPAVSDPGARLVARVREAGYAVVPLPGRCAAVAALSVSGFAEGGFRFVGFLSAKSGARRTALSALRDEPDAMVFYEAPHRILESVADMAEIFGGEREILIAREMSKVDE